MSLRARLTVGTACTLAVAIAIGLFAAYIVVRGQLRGEIDRSLKALALPITQARSRPLDHRRPRLPRTLQFPPHRTPDTLGGAAGYFQAVSAAGKVSLPPGETIHLPVGDARAVAAGHHVAYFTDATVNRTHLRIYTTRLDNQTALQIARPLSEVDQVLSRIRLLFLIISVLAIAAAAAVGLLVARATLRPVKRLTEDAERIATTRDLSDRTAQPGSDEVGRLAIAFNIMLNALASSVTAQRQLVADASHELRTPLATVRTNLETLELHTDIPSDDRRRILAEATEQLREMTHLIDELVELARGDAQPLSTVPTRLDHIAEDAVAAARRRSPVQIRLKTTPATVEADPAALTRAISNLLDNALKWSPPDASVEVTVQDQSLTVQDQGPGIDPTDLPHIFDRFYRARNARTLPGSGLGLAIVKQVAEAHHGTITVQTGPDGTLFSLQLPK